LYQTYSAYQDAYGQILTTIGMDPVPTNASADTDLAQLATAIGEHLKNP
jgi:hypothetical protein